MDFLKKVLAIKNFVWYHTQVRYAYRYAMMWEVAGLEPGNFHGVCPIYKPGERT